MLGLPYNFTIWYSLTKISYKFFVGIVLLRNLFIVFFQIFAFGLLGFCQLCVGNWFTTLRDNISVPSSRVKQSKKKTGKKWILLYVGEDVSSDLLSAFSWSACPFNMAPIYCPGQPVTTYIPTPCLPYETNYINVSRSSFKTDLVFLPIEPSEGDDEFP